MGEIHMTVNNGRVELTLRWTAGSDAVPVEEFIKATTGHFLSAFEDVIKHGRERELSLVGRTRDRPSVLDPTGMAQHPDRWIKVDAVQDSMRAMLDRVAHRMKAVNLDPYLGGSSPIDVDSPGFRSWVHDCLDTVRKEFGLSASKP